jgi:hypothetical protein
MRHGVIGDRHLLLGVTGVGADGALILLTIRPSGLLQ